MFKVDVYFRNIEIIKLLLLIRKMSINSVADMVSYTPQFKHKSNQKAATDCTERCWMLYIPM